MPLLVAAAAFLAGSVPFAYLVARLALGVDVRTRASGNPGATNAARLWSARWRPMVFLLLFALDAGKGYLAATLLPRLIAPDHPYGPAAAAVAAVLGHVFTPFLGWRGGKGVATTVGVLLALEPLAATIAVGAFLAVLAVTRVVALGSLALAVALPVAVLLHGTAPPPVRLAAGALGLLIVVRHKTNIGRMLRRAS